MKPDRKNTVISTSADVARLEVDVRTHKRRRVGRLSLDIPGMEEERQNRLAVAINRGYFACGCAEGTALGFVGLVGGAVYAWTQGMIPDQWLSALGWTLGSFAVGVTVGKFVGKRFAERHLSAAVSELRDHFGPEELPSEKPTARCAVHGA